MFFQEAVRVAPSFYPPYIFLGGLFTEEDDHMRALEYLQKALLLKEFFIIDDPNTKLLYFYLGRAYQQKGDKVASEDNFRIFASLAKGDKMMANEYKAALELLRSQK